MKAHVTIAVLYGALAPTALNAADEAPGEEELAFFESKIRPALVDYCYQCHSEDEKIKGGLRLDTRDGARHGGSTGEAVVPGDLDASLLWAAINWADEDYEMPPKQKLPGDVIEYFRKWIVMGAPDPRATEAVVVETEIDIEKGRDFWSFQAPVDVAAPEVVDGEWPRSDIDRFILSKLEDAGLAPAAEAGPEVLLRRLSFDLTGLPPTMEEIYAFADAWKTDPDAAYGAKVDALLASSHFGERWGRHWLDVARYAESSGKDVNVTFPHAWRYRDYVIDAFNMDKPYDEFLTEQIAGDLIAIDDDADWRENLIATGFLAIGTKGLNEQNPRQFALDVVDEQIDATTQAIIGLTVSCARCHDHKSDPIPTADYYALAGIFQSTKTYFGTLRVGTNRRGSKLLELPVPDARPVNTYSVTEVARMRDRLESVERELVEAQEESRRQRREGGGQVNVQALLRLRNAVAQARSRLEGVDENGVAKSFVMGVQDHGRAVEPTVLVRGELDRPAQSVARGFLQVLHHPGTPDVLPEAGSGRLELARWLTSDENPLTARVMVNRVWQHLFGRGIVASPNNFGATGQAPTHPGLLDDLAIAFMEGGWSVKSLVRSLVGSSTYRMSSTFNPDAYANDPDNALRWRASPRRLDAEAMRDAMLVASGQLDRERPLASIVAEIGDTRVGRRVGARQIEKPVRYRSVYLPAVRGALPEALALFDPADADIVTGTRESSNVPGQALYLMNNRFVIDQAEAMARRLAGDAGTRREQVSRAFLICFGRPVTGRELDATNGFFRSFRMADAGGGAEDIALAAFCQSLLASAEFRYLN